MLSELLFSLRNEWSPLNVFRYITFRAAIGALSAFLLCYLFLPPWINYVRRRKMGQLVRKDGPKTHLKKAGTPTMGGLIMVLVSAVCILLWVRPRSHLVWLSLGSLLWFAGIGMADDWLKFTRRNTGGLSATSKLLWQSVGAIILVAIYSVLSPWGLEGASMLSLPFLRNPVTMAFSIYLFVAMLVIVGTTNSVNITDGLDGLAAGCCAFAASGLGVYAYLVGNKGFASYLRILYVPEAGELAVICAILTGACLGFLWFNAYPAEVFMGDVGALGLGGALGSLAVFIKAEVVLAIFGGVFVAEALSVLFQVASFRLLKRRIFKMAPLHHHFELGGIPEAKVIVRFWIFSLLLIVAMLSTLKLR